MSELIKLKYLCKSFCTPIMQQQLKEQGLYEVYGAAGIAGYMDTYNVDTEYLGIVKDGAGVGRVNKYKPCTSLLGTLAYIIPNDQVDIDWLKYIIFSMDLGNDIGKTTIPHIYFSNYGNNKVSYITYDKQKTMARYIEKKCVELDNVLKKTRASIEEYKKLKQAVITQTVTKGIRDNREMKDSGIEWLGSIPANWNLIKITRLLDYGHLYPIGDGDHGLIKTDDYIDLGVPYIRVQNLGWGTELNYDNLVYISEERNQMIANSILKPNDILFAKTGATIGKTAIIPDSIPVSNTTSHIGKITVSPNYNPRFVFYVMSSYVVYRQFWEMAGLKTTRPELSIDEIKKIRIAIPSTLEEQDSIVKYLDRICKNLDKLINKKESYLAEIENYKKSFIYEYVTGKKEVLDT